MYLGIDDPLLKSAVAGKCLRLPSRKPPWIVVDHHVETVIVARWPGRLWTAEATDPVSDADLPSASHRLVSNVWYTRAVAVTLIEELPTARLFGAHGENVCAVIEEAGRLNPDRALQFQRALDPDSGGAYSRAWTKWLPTIDSRIQACADDCSSVLGVGAMRGSPINGGFALIDSEVRKRARTVAGEAAFIVDEDGEESIASPWSEASSALLHAAMCFGAPEFISHTDRGILARAWRKVVGPEPH